MAKSSPMTPAEPAKRPNEPAEIVKYWLNEIAAAKKRDKQFFKDGQDILDIYDSNKDHSDASDGRVPFNILFSNTETMFPALYSATPRPVVQRRFKDDDPLGKAAAEAGKRMLEFLIDTNVEGYETFDDVMQNANLDGLLPGRAFSAVKYDAKMTDLPTTEGEEAASYADSELVCVETKSWNRCYHGYAKKWANVPWVAYEDQVDKQRATELFGKVIADKLVYSVENTDREKDDADRRSQEPRDKGELKTCTIYQIWDKDGSDTEPPKQVKYISPQYPDGYLKTEDDPLGLTGFYNCPKPLMYVKKSNDLRPTPLYNTYARQAKELNRLTIRILRLVEAIKARGVYDGSLGGDLKSIMQADDNELIPSDTAATLSAEKGLDNAIWMWPVDKLIIVLRELYQARESCKQVIYEITGISDIVRGASKASETLGAQQIKEQWGTMRLKRLQKEMQRYVRDMLRLMLELAASKFNEETWAKMTGLPYLTTMQVQQMTMIAQAGDAQAAQRLQSTPTWQAVLGILNNDLQRAYRIDIETNSTIEPEAAEDQKQIADLMTALGQYLNGVAPLVEKGVMPFGVAQSMLLAITRRFRFGNEIEDYIKQMQAPAPQDDGKQAEMQAKMQMEQQKMQMDAQQKQAEMQAAQQEKAVDLQMDRQRDAEKLQLEMAKIQAERETAAMQIAAEKDAKLAELNAQRQTDKLKMQMEQETELKKAALQGAVQIEVAKISATQKAAQADGEATMQREAQVSHDDMMAKVMETQAKLLEAVSAPKTIERDGQGRALRVVPQV